MARGLQPSVGSVPSRGAKTYDAVINHLTSWLRLCRAASLRLGTFALNSNRTVPSSADTFGFRPPNGNRPGLLVVRLWLWRSWRNPAAEAAQFPGWCCHSIFRADM